MLAMIILTALAGSVHAALLNVQILGHASDSKGGPDEKPPAYTGGGIIGAEGAYWNGVKAEAYGQPLMILRPRKMFTADGKTLVGVKLTFSGFVGADHWPASEGAPVNNALLNSYLVSGAGASVTIEGLVPEAAYDLCLFGNNSHAGAGAKFAVNGGAPQHTQGTQGAVFSKGVDYVEFTGATADKEGRLKITLDAVDPGKFPAGIFNGLQLRGEIPPPAANAQQPAKISWAVKLWLKADDLARAGLKSGDPVTQWKDAFRGIRFGPNSKPPCSDKTPIYVEIRVPGNPNPVPVVQFDGYSSLRQLDALDVKDEQMTAYVVYRTTEDGPWKKLMAKRDWACCTYDGGIATPRNPRLVYTAYQETGVRLGAIDTLPLSITGHQGDNNPDERFKGSIAEVIVFAELFDPDDEQREAVESYLQEKYFDEVGKDRVAPEVPWTGAKPGVKANLPTDAGEGVALNPMGRKDKPASESSSVGSRPASSATPVREMEEPVAKADLPQDADNSVALNKVSVFSLTNQDRVTDTEYAAGDVTLPFSYTAEVSTAPRPSCLDFAGWPNPDCCHSFVRIEGELWMFRIAWIVDKGRTMRYKGPDIDHMTQVEDGTYPPEVGLGWFLGGMWYDESDRELYAPVHVEQEGSNRFHPAVGWFSRKIALATSTDKGRTWKYEGDIITPETYFFNHEAYKFSGSYFGNGVCDFGFYVDHRSGYFYIFPDESWYMKGQWGALWGTRAARCAIRDKMAPGKWKYFYNGKWDEPALGGKSSIVAPSHFWGVLYSSYLDRYICIFPSNKDPWWPPYSNVDGMMIGACSDLSKQDWVWGYYPEAMFGFLKVFDGQGTDLATCGQTIRHYATFANNTFQRIDITLQKGQMSANNWMPRYPFEPHPESSDPILGRRTKIVGSASPETKYSGTWADRSEETSYEGKFKESSSAGSSIEFPFAGADVYWRAVRSPNSGKADVYLDGALRKTVDCYSPRSTSCEVFVYLKTGLDPNKNHTIKIVTKGEKNPRSEGTAIGHIAFEYSAESYRASAGFCSLMGKNHWYYQQRKGSQDSDMQFIPRDDVFVKDWFGEGTSRIGSNYQIPADNVQAVRKWIAPHGGEVRVEGKVALEQKTGGGVLVRLEHCSRELWRPEQLAAEKLASHDLTLKVEQGDAISFVVGMEPAAGKTAGADAGKVVWDPVITYTQSVPAVWKPNAPGSQNIALGKYARSKMLVYTYQPFKAVDGDSKTAFAIYADDKISSGDDWLQVDLDKKYRIDRYVVVSKPPVTKWRPTEFTLQKSDDGFAWTGVDSVSNNASERVDRRVAAFTARYVRLYLPRGKPFSIAEFELYYTGAK
jgi:hypothetical protein